ncbi:hypothetical protein IscW_ISCW011256, partial [Ixodes scapularis]
HNELRVPPEPVPAATSAGVLPPSAASALRQRVCPSAATGWRHLPTSAPTGSSAPLPAQSAPAVWRERLRPATPSSAYHRDCPGEERRRLCQGLLHLRALHDPVLLLLLRLNLAFNRCDIFFKHRPSKSAKLSGLLVYDSGSSSL